MKLLRSEADGALVKSIVEVDGVEIVVRHFDLPPDETGIFDVAHRLATEPAVEEAKAEKVGGKLEPIEPVAPVAIDKSRLDKAEAVAAKLNKLGTVEIKKVESIGLHHPL